MDRICFRLWETAPLNGAVVVNAIEITSYLLFGAVESTVVLIWRL